MLVVLKNNKGDVLELNLLALFILIVFWKNLLPDGFLIIILTSLCY